MSKIWNMNIYFIFIINWINHISITILLIVYWDIYKLLLLFLIVVKCGPWMVPICVFYTCWDDFFWFGGLQSNENQITIKTVPISATHIYILAHIIYIEFIIHAQMLSITIKKHGIQVIWVFYKIVFI